MSSEPTPIHCCDCGDEFRRGEPGSDPVMCRFCWYSGEHLKNLMMPVLVGLAESTGTMWFAEHTGGSCFWLATYLDADPQGRMICVTQFPDVLSGDSTPEVVEDDGGWLVGAYRTWEDPLLYLPEGHMDAEYGLTTDELFAAVRDAQHQLIKEAA